METVKTTINLPLDLVQQIDAMAATAGQTRTEVITQLLTAAVAQMNPLRAADQIAEQIAELREEIAKAPTSGSGAAAFHPKLALLLVEIAARVTQKDPAKLESTRAAYKKLYLP